jgi:hypothetical protein
MEKKMPKMTAISDMEEDRYNRENRVFKISNLQIMLDLNKTSKTKDSNIMPFNYDMYFHPDLEKDAPKTTSKVPFFTNEAQYPFLQSKPLKDRVEFFFNLEKFTEIVRSEGSNWVEPLEKDTDIEERNAQIRENEQANIAAMLRALFPISGEFGNALTSSYDNHILQNTNWEVVYGIDAMELVNLFGFAERFGFIDKNRNASYLKIGGKPKSIFSVTWENDVVNHPVYRKFIETYIVQLKRTQMNQYEVYSGLDTKKSALDAKLTESWENYSVKDQVYKSTNLSKLTEILGMGKGDTPLYKVEKKLNQISESELVDKWKARIKLSEFMIPSKKKLKSAINKITAINAFKDALSKKQDGVESGEIMTPQEIAKALKDTNTIGSLIHYLEGQSASSNDDRYERYGRSSSSAKERDVIQRMSNKLTSLNSANGTKGIAAANVFFEVNDMMTENNISLGEYGKMFKEYLNLAVEVKAANHAYLFVSENRPIPVAKNGVFANGTKETESDKLVDRKVRENYGPIMQQSEELANSVFDVYVPKRKTSNINLFELIEKISGKQKPKKEETVNRDEQRAKDHVFDKIYRKYLAKKPMNYPLSQLKKYMYTGVDTTVKPPQQREEKDDKKKTEEPGISEEFSEIYVRINFVDKMNYDQTSKAQCRWKDDVLKNELHYLLDLNSTSYVNPFRDYDLAEEYAEASAPPMPLPDMEKDIEKKDISKDGLKKKGGKRQSRKLRPNRGRKTRHLLNK